MANSQHLSLEEQEVVRALQQELPLVSRPYKMLAENLNMTEEQFLDTVNSLQKKGCLKRISIALRHNNVGFTVNVLAAWVIDSDLVDQIGEELVHKSYITHCYRRSVSETFPYNFYTMIHARSEEDFQSMVDEVASLVEERTGKVPEYVLLRSVSELKKTGMKYFIEKPDEIVYE